MKNKCADLLAYSGAFVRAQRNTDFETSRDVHALDRCWLRTRHD